MDEFKEVWDYLRFEATVSSRIRFFRDPTIETFLTTVLATAASRKISLTKGSTVWRAQLGMSEITEEKSDDGSLTFSFEPYPKERMKPRSNSAKEGRVNSIGLPRDVLLLESFSASEDIFQLYVACRENLGGIANAERVLMG
jgi:hypothetical protein